MLRVNCLGGSAVTPLAANLYYAHWTELARQALANTFHQMQQAWLHLIHAVINRLPHLLLNTHAGAGSVAQPLVSAGHKCGNLTTPILVAAVQPATLLSGCGRKQTRERNPAWLDDLLAVLNAPTSFVVTPNVNLSDNLKSLCIADDYCCAVIRWGYSAFGTQFLVPVINISAAPVFQPRRLKTIQQLKKW